MKERSKNFTRQKEKEDAIMNFVSRQAQEAILDPNLPETFKDEVVDAAVGTLLKIAERRSTYDVGFKENRPLKPSQTIYKAK
jgi:hypothetical protein